MKSAVCLQDGYLKWEMGSSKNSIVFIFNKSGLVFYEVKVDGGYLVYHNINGTYQSQIGFPCGESDFNQNFLDVSEFRNLKIEQII